MHCIFFVYTKGDISMRTRIQKWGNSLALRIPKFLAAEVHIEQDSLVEVSLVEGKLILEPVAEPAWTLEELLAGVTEQNLHGEVDTGPATGREAW
jgi:antitoxin MazE